MWQLTWHLYVCSVHSEHPLASPNCCVPSARHFQHTSGEGDREGEGTAPTPSTEPNESWRRPRPVHEVISVQKEDVCGRRADGNDTLECVTLDNEKFTLIKDHAKSVFSVEIPQCLEAGHVQDIIHMSYIDYRPAAAAARHLKNSPGNTT